MRVKSGVLLAGGSEFDGTASHTSTMLETDPEFLARCPPAAPYSLISPFSYMPPAAVPATVVIAAVRVRALPTSKPPAKPSATAVKRKQPPKIEATVNIDKTSAQRNVKPKLAKPAQPTRVLPFKHISTVGLPPMPPTVVAEPEDLNEFYSKQITAERKPKQKRMEDKDASDARVALRVLPGGQLPSRPKSGGKDSSNRSETPLGNKGKPPRAPKRASPSADGASGVAGGHHAGNHSSEWHPGMYSSYGITFIDPMAGKGAAPPPPVFEGAPARSRPMPLTAADLPKFSEDDPVKASLEYLRYLATTIGRLISFPPRLQQGFNLEQRLYRERLSRAMMARDGRSTEKSRPGGTRRSTRTRFAPDVFIPTAAGGPDGRGSVYGRTGRPDRTDGESEGGEGSEEEGMIIQPYDPADLTDVRLGGSYQAELPSLRKRPPTPAAEESKWVENLVLSTGEAPPLSRGTRRMNKKPSYEDKSQAAAISRKVAELTAAVGPTAASDLGLGSMGTLMIKDLTSEQQDQLYEGMRVYGRDFHAISNEFVKGVPPHRMAQYYFDVWKLRAVPAALRWYDDRAQEEAIRAAEAAKLEKQRAEDAIRRAERQEASNRRRQVKEAFQWIRASARGPTEVNFNKPIVRERAGRTGSVLRLIAQSKQ